MDHLIDRSIQEISRGAVYRLLPDETQAQIARLSPEELEAGVRRVFTRPIPGEVSQESRLLLNPCLAVQWLAAFEELELPRAVRVYEPCTGSSEPILLAAEIYSGGLGEYVSVNLNQPLASDLHKKLGKLTIARTIIEDDASTAALPEMTGHFDVACFHHALNDLLETAVAEPRGMDTRKIDWWANERQMIEWLGEENREGRIEGAPRAAVVGALGQAIALLKTGGVMLIDHWTWEAYRNVDWFPWDFFQRIIPLARRWIGENRLPLLELSLHGRDPQWWLAYRKSA